MEYQESLFAKCGVSHEALTLWRSMNVGVCHNFQLK
jgi:hypothetical protein